jgi:hypothetical protein
MSLSGSLKTASARPGIGLSEGAPALRKAQRALSRIASQISYFAKL